jgi:hypothetical protein
MEKEKDEKCKAGETMRQIFNCLEENQNRNGNISSYKNAFEMLLTEGKIMW